MSLKFYVAVWLICLSTAFAGEARIIKVLPQLLDLQGRNAINPSLYDRDAYQDYLRHTPAEVSALRFEVQYKARELNGPLTLRLEIRGSKTKLGEKHIFETPVKSGAWFSKWGRIELDRPTSESVGSLIAWRASLLQNGIVVAELESFLW